MLAMTVMVVRNSIPSNLSSCLDTSLYPIHGLSGRHEAEAGMCDFLSGLAQGRLYIMYTNDTIFGDRVSHLKTISCSSGQPASYPVDKYLKRIYLHLLVAQHPVTLQPPYEENERRQTFLY